MKDTSDIKLDMEALSRNNETYTSITDLYNIHIFTDSNMEEFKEREQVADSYYADVSGTVFLDKKQKKKNALTDSLFLEEMAVSRKQGVFEQCPKVNAGAVVIGALVMIMFVLGMIRYNLYREIRRRENADSGNIYQWK